MVTPTTHAIAWAGFTLLGAPRTLGIFATSSKTRQPQLAPTQNSLFGLCAVLPFSRTKAPHKMTGGFIKKRVYFPQNHM